MTEMNLDLWKGKTFIDLSTIKDEYAKTRISLILRAKTSEQLIEIINNIYAEGFEDGCNDTEEQHGIET